MEILLGDKKIIFTETHDSMLEGSLQGFLNRKCSEIIDDLNSYDQTRIIKSGGSKAAFLYSEAAFKIIKKLAGQSLEAALEEARVIFHRQLSDERMVTIIKDKILEPIRDLYQNFSETGEFFSHVSDHIEGLGKPRSITSTGEESLLSKDQEDFKAGLNILIQSKISVIIEDTLKEVRERNSQTLQKFLVSRLHETEQSLKELRESLEQRISGETRTLQERIALIEARLEAREAEILKLKEKKSGHDLELSGVTIHFDSSNPKPDCVASSATRASETPAQATNKL